MHDDWCMIPMTLFFSLLLHSVVLICVMPTTTTTTKKGWEMSEMSSKNGLNPKLNLFASGKVLFMLIPKSGFFWKIRYAFCWTALRLTAIFYLLTNIISWCWNSFSEWKKENYEKRHTRQNDLHQQFYIDLILFFLGRFFFSCLSFLVCHFSCSPISFISFISMVVQCS